jgi:prevent-host-death family protein
MKITSSAFQQHVGKYLESLKRSETNEILITVHGKPEFKIIPLNKPQKTKTEELLELLEDIPGIEGKYDSVIKDTKLKKVTNYEDLT